MKGLDTFRISAPALALIAITACSVETKNADSTAAADSGVSTAPATAPMPAGTAPAPAAAPSAGMAPAAPTSSASASGGWIDPNSASRADLAGIPGMTDALVTAVIAGRPYANMVAVDKLLARNLSETQRDSVYVRLWKPVNLNTASGEEILLIPGVGPRMRHEFEEYRPYTSIEQFRREIGKYVDNAEVARLERYVVVVR